MSSNLKVNSIVPATGSNVAIGTAGGTISYNASVSGVSTFSQLNVSSQLNVGVGGTVITTSVDGNIGLGTNNPVLGKCEIHCPGTTNHLILKDTTNNWVSKVQVSTGGTFTIKSGDTEHLRIDTSGRVTTPYQPAFCVSRQNGESGASSHSVPQFTTEFFNIGNHFSLSTQRFTAPVSGTYLFTGHVIPTGLAQNSGFELWIAVNSSTVSTARRFLDRKKKIEADSNSFSVGGSVTIQLAANDWVQLTTTTATYSDETNCKFSGYLVG